MAVTLWTLLQAVILFANAFAVLNEDRFLKKHGLTINALTRPSAADFYSGSGSGQDQSSMKAQIAGFIHVSPSERRPSTLTPIVRTPNEGYPKQSTANHPRAEALSLGLGSEAMPSQTKLTPASLAPDCLSYSFLPTLRRAPTFACRSSSSTRS